MIKGISLIEDNKLFAQNTDNTSIINHYCPREKASDKIKFFISLRIRFFSKFFCSLRNFLKNSILFFIFYFSINHTSNATIADQTTQVTDILTNLTCETSGVGNLLRSDFSHTCIPAPFFDAMVANILSPGLYVTAVLKLKINDEDLFPKSCTAEKRIDPVDPTISFAFCNNLSLAGVTAQAAINASSGIISDLIHGASVNDAVTNNFRINKASYHKFINNAKPEDTGLIWDIPFPIPWKVVKYRDQICVATQSIAGWMNVGCKYMKEPYPDSIYDINPQMKGLMNCPSSQTSCMDRAKANAVNMTSISGPIVTCAKEMITRLMINPDYCGDQTLTPTQIISGQTNFFYNFQTKMYRAVMAFLTLYIIFVGFTIVLGKELPQKGQLVMYVLKVILVIYFSVGINNNYQTHGFDGITEWAFPIMFNGSSETANWILNTSPSGLCRFDATDYNSAVAGNYNLYSVWDALDCRVLHYLGLNFMSDNQNSSALLNFSIPPYILLLIPAVISGCMQLVMLAISYPLLVISVAAYLVNTFIMSLISIVILGVLAPIFVPMVLFEFTKGYFTAWFKLIISFVLQPTIIATFLIVMFSVYDQSFYNSCKYNSFTTSPGNGTSKKVFFLNTNKADYTDKDYMACLTSLGGMINFRLAMIINTTLGAMQSANISVLGPGSYSYQLTANPLNDVKVEDVYKSFDFLKNLNSKKGIFVTGFTIIFEYIKDLIWAMFSGCVILYLMYHFSDQLSSFAADITESVSLGSTTIGAKTVFNNVNAAIGTAGGSGDGSSGASGGGAASSGSGGGSIANDGGASGGGSGFSARTLLPSGQVSDTQQQMSNNNNKEKE